MDDDFIQVVDFLCDLLDEEEEEYQSNPITLDMIDKEFFTEHADYLGVSTNKLMAMCLFCDVPVSALENVRHEYGNHFSIEGRDYLVVTDDEADDEHRDYIESLVDDIGWDAFGTNAIMNVELDEYKNVVVSQSIHICSNER